MEKTDTSKLVNGSTALQGSLKSSRKVEIFSIVFAFVCLFSIGLICFLPTVKHVGFYLDDWIMLNTLSSGPDGFWELFAYYFSADPRVVKRPIEALHFVTKFTLFGERPVGYHVANIFMEVGAAWLFYLCLFKITKQKVLSLLSSILFFLYPSHNSTHYWVVCGSVTLSQILYLGSLYLNIEGVLRKKTGLHVVSAILFLVGLLNYEIFLPLSVLNIALVLLIGWKQNSFKSALRAVGTVVGLLAICAGLLGFYVKVIVPRLGVAWLHAVSFDSNIMWETLSKGLNINLPWVSFAYFNKFVAFKFEQGLSTYEFGLLALSMLVIVGIVWIGERLERDSTINKDSLFPGFKGFNLPKPVVDGVWLFLIGAVTIFLSYTIFGVNKDYMPTFLTLVNRMNSGATIGIGLIFASIFSILGFLLGKRSKGYVTLLSILAMPVVLYLIICTWAMSRPYVLSWQLQSHIKNSVKAQAQKIQGAEDLLLINVPRYVDEAPLFDGVWDFQSMVRMTLKRKDIQCGVVGERFRFSKKKVQDVHGGLVLSSYTFDKLFVIVSPSCELVKVDNANELLNLVASKGMQFENDKTLVEKWRKQIELNDDLESNNVKTIDATFE